MALFTTYTSCGPVIANDEWTAEFLAGISQLEQGRGSQLTYKEKQGLWLLAQIGGTAGGGGATTSDYSDDYSDEYGESASAELAYSPDYSLEYQQ